LAQFFVVIYDYAFVKKPYASSDGSLMDEKECKIFKSLLAGRGTSVEDEVFWRSDGTQLDVAYSSYPQFRNGEIVGAVVTFTDNTERRKNQARVNYLTYHDSLTGLYNRTFFEEELKRLDREENLPLTIIFGDLNGLKLTNDVFGHTAGDELLKKSAEALKKACRKDDVIARVGGRVHHYSSPHDSGDRGKNLRQDQGGILKGPCECHQGKYCSGLRGEGCPRRAG